MKLQVNFKSFIAIGRFNPSILSPGFLKEHCSFESGHDPSGRNTPVITEIKFGNIQFLMELDKFQILVSDIADFNDKYPIDVIIRYLEVLKYTPITLFGVNFNYTLHDVNIRSIMQIAMEPFQIGKRLSLDPNSVAMRAIRSNGKELMTNEITVSHHLKNGVKNTVSLAVENDTLRTNSNYEIDGLHEDRLRVNILIENYPEFVEHNHGLVQLLEDLSNGA